jgi:hypothetical protein
MENVTFQPTKVRNTSTMKLANKEIFPTFNAFYTPLFRRE